MAWHGALTPEALWRGRGDSPSRVWIIVLAYLLAAVCCVMAWLQNASWVWMAVAALLLILALDRKLDFLAWVIARGRQYARTGGWYWSHRRVFQKIGTAMLLGVGIGLILICAGGWRGLTIRQRIAGGGSIYLLSLILLRAISLHEVDRLLYRKRRLLLGLPLNLVIEPLGIAVVACSALWGVERLH